MKLIIGGAFQGKLDYAKAMYGVTEGWIDGGLCRLDEIENCRGIYRFHEYVKRLLEGKFSGDSLSGLEQQAREFAGALYRRNPDILIVSNELGCGVVPIEKEDRLWRETVGRICTCLASEADEVVRVVCGVGMRLK